MARPKVIKHNAILTGLRQWLAHELTGGYGLPYTAKVRYVLVYGPMMRVVFEIKIREIAEKEDPPPRLETLRIREIPTRFDPEERTWRLEEVKP